MAVMHQDRDASRLMATAEPGLQPTSHHQSDIMLSVVCPFFNEEPIIENAVLTLLKNMAALEASWELIVVNDGSVDGSYDIVKRLSAEHPRLQLLSYAVNKGRGYALRTGIRHARGDIIITTEIDLSWGEDIVARLYTTMDAHPEVDIVVASPHLPGGGYKNVPWKRVFFSRFGNWMIRACMTNTVTMNTGMTRAYRKQVIQSMPLEENRKEFHLEVIMKAQAFNYHLHEIPCVLEWKTYKHEGERVQRKSASKINQLVISHTLFSLFANPIRYVWGLSAVSMGFSVFFLVWSFVRLLTGLVSVFTFTVSLAFVLIGILLFTFGVIAQQGYMIQKEIWSLKKSTLALQKQWLEEKLSVATAQDTRRDPDSA